MIDDPIRFIRENTQFLAPPLVPEIKLHLATEVVPLWRKTEEELAEQGIPPPYWAFAWAGGQALARYVLDHPELVRGKSVLDFGSGSGLVALAARKAGAVAVTAADIDHLSGAAVALNAQQNELEVHVIQDDVIGTNGGWQIILVGDMCYERPLAERLMAWLMERKRADIQILLGDPGRSYFPKDAMEQLATFRVQTTRELEDREIRETGVYRLK